MGYSAVKNIPIPSLSPDLERRRKIPVKQAALLIGISEATFRRHYAHLILQVSKRRQAVELGKALDAA